MDTFVTQTCAAASTDVDDVDVDDVEDVVDDELSVAADTAETISRSRIQLVRMIFIFMVPPGFKERFWEQVGVFLKKTPSCHAAVACKTMRRRPFILAP
ncbi:MAG: hypothetical protein WC586_09020 [Methanoregula sp.]